ncbi:MAG: hypothetical protein ACRYFX_03700 [Janthinobacterium lividum]
MTSRLHLTLPLLALLAACTGNDASPKTAVAAQPGATQQQAASSQLHIPLTSAVFLDNSDYVLYPLALGEMREREDEYGSKRYEEASTYWNIIFYNVRNGTTRLLADNQKMFIKSYGALEAADTHAQNQTPYPPAEKLLVYSAIVTDSNQDGQLTDDDPTYLFISDKSGENFHQISPRNLSVTGWQLYPGTGKMLLQTSSDSNHDHAFTTDDESTPYVYDLATGQPATRVISPEFMQALKAKLQQQWGSKSTK